MLKKSSFRTAFASFHDHWNPRIVASLNEQYVKVAKVKGEFDWHFHQHEDELFLVHRGTLQLFWKDSGETHCVELHEGEFFVVPRGVEHRPVAADEVELVLFEPAGTVNTGNIENERTRHDLDAL